jgi:outer membrane protein assembly factor BamB
MGAMDDGEHVVCVDVATGKKLWSARVDDRVYENNWGNGPRCTPTVAGENIYAVSGNGRLVCLEVNGGKLVWSVDFVKDLGGKIQSWGFTESVLVDGDRVICTPGGSKGTLAALDRRTGKVLWRSKGVEDVAQYSSPLVVTHGGQRQYVQLVTKRLFGVKAETGELVWQTDFPGRTAVIPTPIHQDGLVYVTAGYNAGSRQFKLGGAEPAMTHESNKMVNHHGGVILVDGKLYGHSDRGGWTCQDWKTGEALWQDRSLGKGACTYVAGHLVCIEEQKGTVVLIEASPAGWKEKGRFTLSPQTEKRKPQGKVWVHPVVLDGRLYLRDQELIHCYDVKG